MREIRTSGSVGAPGERSPGATRRMGNTSGHKRQRYQTALGSAREVIACVDVAKAMRYISAIDTAVLDRMQHVVATLIRLVR